MRIRIRSLAAFQVLVLLLSGSLTPSVAKAFEIRAGQSWIEQGDYLLHPGVQLTAATKDNKSLRFEFSGRTFGRFTQSTSILSLNLPYEVLPWKEVYTTYGFSLMDEYTAYNSKQGEDESIHAFNAGLNLGIGYKIYDHGGFNARLEWNSHIFAAGLAFIFMTTARKTVFSATVGYEL
ncbi:MAG: hypothetical protein EOP10_17260 [Proteobacteria bacterium]|nr:MAG: hypothetical protein EOP10_17260 [Pseudomonadota bacterium]